MTLWFHKPLKCLESTGRDRQQRKQQKEATGDCTGLEDGQGVSWDKGLEGAKPSGQFKRACPYSLIVILTILNT